MAYRVPVFCNPNTNKLWTVNQNTLTIVEFAPQLTAPETNFGGHAIWGAPTGEIITEARKTADNDSHMYHLAAAAGAGWTDEQNVGQRIFDIHGTTYQNVWAVGGDSHQVWHWNGTTWTLDATLSSGRMVQVATVGSGLDETFIAAHNQVWFRTGGAIGSGTWVDRRAQLLTDTGIDISGSLPDCVGVWATSKTAVYFLIYGTRHTTQHYIVKWNGSSFATISTPQVNNYDTDYGTLDGTAESNLWWMQADNQRGEWRFVKFDGINIYRQQGSGPIVGPEHNLSQGCNLALLQPGDQSAYSGYAAGKRYGQSWLEVWGFTGSAWEQVDTYTPPLASVLTGVTLAISSSPPYVQSQDPAPDETNVAPSASVALDIVDDQGDLDATTVRIYVNGTLAVTGATAAPGFTLTRAAVTGPAGFSHVIQPASAFEAGEQLVRVVAQDSDGNALDTTYSFVVNAALAVATTEELAAEVADQQPPPGIDLRLDTAHDVVVTEYDLELVAGADEVAQHLLVGLRLFRSEWYLDEDAGVPYYSEVLVNAPSSRVIEGLMRQQILGDADVEALTSFAVAVDRASRKLDVSFVAVSSVGVVDVDALFP